ncbi:hypothetical protein MKX03_007911 [Papaver bracteatum]|nr:hypothetical protein MKX03_007911 [Papaver bracteatum]
MPDLFAPGEVDSLSDEDQSYQYYEDYEDKASYHVFSRDVFRDGKEDSSKENPNVSYNNLLSNIPRSITSGYYFSLQDRSSEDSVAKTSFPAESLDLSIEWLERCLADLNNSTPGFGNLSDAEKGKLIIKEFLLSDMKLSCGGGEGKLPKDIGKRDGIVIREALVLQVNEVIDIGYYPLHRFVGIPPGRMLRLSMTDGVQCVFGITDRLRPIEDLQVFASAGFKVLIDNVKVYGGRLKLEPGHLKVLGGMVPHLEAERQKSVESLGMQAWIKSTPDAWKLDAVDNSITIPDNSPWLDAFYSRPNIQARLVDKMDVIHSFQSEIEEEAQDWEVEELDSEVEEEVPKNWDPEALKQSVGQQTEVLNAGNTFLANTTCEAELEQLNAIITAAEPTYETLLPQLQEIWDEVGQCEPVREEMLCQLKQECLDVCRRKVNETVKSKAHLEQLLQHISSQCHPIDDEWQQMLVKIQQECLNVYQRKIDQDVKSKDNLLQDMNFMKKQLISLASVLGVDGEALLALLPKKSLAIRKQYSDIVREIERLLRLREGRKEKFAEVHSRIQKILEEIGGTCEFPEHAEDLSLELLETKLREFQSARVEFHKKKKMDSVSRDVTKEKMKGLEKEKEMTQIGTDLTALCKDSVEMLGQVKNWLSACKLYSWLEDCNREENSSSSGADLNLIPRIQIPDGTSIAKTQVCEEDYQTDKHAMGVHLSSSSLQYLPCCHLYILGDNLFVYFARARKR